MRRLSLILALLLASCTQYIWPGDEVTAMRECVMHDGLARFSSSSISTTGGGWHPRYNYELSIKCRDGSEHLIIIRTGRDL